MLRTLTEEEKEARARALVDANRDAEVARQRAAEEAKRREAEDKARQAAEEEHRRRLAEEEARKKAEEEMKRKADALVQKRMDQADAKHLFEPTGDFQCLHEFIPAARAKLSDHIWGYLVGAAESETTMRRNRLANRPAGRCE